MKYIDLFAGIGGFSLAAKRIGGFECLGFSDIDNRPISVYQDNFPSHKLLGDITKINPSELPDIDFVFGGSPCQSWSQSGSRLGFNDPRGKLFFDYANILKVKQPKYFIFENVLGLLTHANGDSFLTVKKILEDSGYTIHYQIMNSENHGVAQRRHRVYVIGFRKDLVDEFNRFQFPQEDKDFKVIDDILDDDKTKYSFYPDAKMNHFFESYDTFKPGRLKDVLTKFRGIRFNQRKVLYTNGITPTLTTKSSDLMIWHNNKARQLTPNELEQLQDFPKGWTKALKSQSAVNYVIGNAITVKVAEKIIRNILT